VKTQIPIYRAKKIDSDEYVEGYYFNAEIEKQHIIMKQVTYDVADFEYDNNEDEIDPSTLAIHFPDMLDANGKKIFASLSEDSVGGSYATDDTKTLKFVSSYDSFSKGFRFCHKGMKTIGIYKGKK